MKGFVACVLAALPAFAAAALETPVHVALSYDEEVGCLGAPALIADLAPAGRRGSAFGWYNLALGLGALPASLLFGALWDARGSAFAFTTGAVLALTAALGVVSLVPSLAPGSASPRPASG